MICIIHPSRGRPEKSWATIKKWMPLQSCQIIVSLDYDDPTIDKYLEIYSNEFSLKPSAWHRIIINNNRSAIDAINKAAELSLAFGDWMIVVSDDSEPCSDVWPDKVYQSISGKRDWILKVQDGIQPWIITQPIMDMDYYNRFGYIYHPDYLHMFCDTELTCVADMTGRKITSDLLFPHKHYSVTHEPPDAVNKKADATWAQGEKLFIERYKRNFDLKEVHGKIQDQGMVNWLRIKAR
jgi:hypothetical protein